MGQYLEGRDHKINGTQGHKYSSSAGGCKDVKNVEHITYTATNMMVVWTFSIYFDEATYAYEMDKPYM